MSKSNAMTVIGGASLDVVPEDRIELLRHTYGSGCTLAEFDLFVAAARRLRLDPFAKQIVLVPQRKKVGEEWLEVMEPTTTIDGFRVVAERTGLYEGQTDAEWCGRDGVWKTVWLDDEPPMAARVGVFRKGFREPMASVAKFSAYAARKRDGDLIGWWKKSPDHMLAKCAEALALRKAFPNTLGGLYTREEMGQADTRPEATVEDPRPQPAKKAAEPAVVDVECEEAVDWLSVAEGKIKSCGWSTAEAAAVLSARYSRAGDWSKWSSLQKAVEWVASSITAGKVERPEMPTQAAPTEKTEAPADAAPTPTKADVLRHAQSLKVSPRNRDAVIREHFGMSLDDLPAKNYAEAMGLITDYAQNEKADQ